MIIIKTHIYMYMSHISQKRWIEYGVCTAFNIVLRRREKSPLAFVVKSLVIYTISLGDNMLRIGPAPQVCPESKRDNVH